MNISRQPSSNNANFIKREEKFIFKIKSNSDDYDWRNEVKVNNLTDYKKKQ